MLRASRDGEDRPLWEQDRALPVGLAQGDVQLAVEYQEELVGVVVDVPDVLPRDLGDAYRTWRKDPRIPFPRRARTGSW